MRAPSAILVLAALSGCNAGPPQDCEVAFKQGVKCLENHKGVSDLEMLVACFPFSKSERITGTWVDGFETNEFYEGETPSLSLINKGVGDTELEIKGTEQSGPFPKVFEMDFVGRRSRCDMGFPHHIIVVERVISRREFAAP